MPAPEPSHARFRNGRIQWWPSFAACLLLTMLAACSAPEIKPPPEPATRSDATAAFARGDYAAAARAWQDEALQAPPQQAAALQISAADAWLLAGDAASAQRALHGVSKAELSTADQARLDLVLADLALRAARPDEADALLRQAADSLPAASQGRYRDLQAQTRQMLAGPASRGLARAAQISGDMAFYNPDAAVEVMRALEDVSSNELSVRATNPRADRQFVGWLDLALVTRQNLVGGDAIGPAIAGWKARHPYHLRRGTGHLASLPSAVHAATADGRAAAGQRWAEECQRGHPRWPDERLPGAARRR